MLIIVQFVFHSSDAIRSINRKSEKLKQSDFETDFVKFEQDKKEQEK